MFRLIKEGAQNNYATLCASFAHVPKGDFLGRKTIREKLREDMLPRS